AAAYLPALDPASRAPPFGQGLFLTVAPTITPLSLARFTLTVGPTFGWYALWTPPPPAAGPKPPPILPTGNALSVGVLCSGRVILNDRVGLIIAATLDVMFPAKAPAPEVVVAPGIALGLSADLLR